ncbi:MAG: hypothetical protein BroJett021_34760 [Chloroflexota bacterium]|jgi:hypothetical protein|nr:MAG: hypothetical protein BroJett021_34760 [Chloroflexota bacterium]
MTFALADALPKIEIPVQLIDAMIENFLSRQDDFELRTRFADPEVMAMCRKAASDVAVASTLAQVLDSRDEFDAALDEIEFSRCGDSDIARLKAHLVEEALDIEPIDGGVAADELGARFVCMRQLLEV